MLQHWMIATTTGAARVRRGLPRHWLAGDKTGTGGGDGVTVKCNDVVWIDHRAPLVVAVYFDTGVVADWPSDADQEVLAEVGRIVARMPKAADHGATQSLRETAGLVPQRGVLPIRPPAAPGRADSLLHAPSSHRSGRAFAVSQAYGRRCLLPKGTGVRRSPGGGTHEPEPLAGRRLVGCYRRARIGADLARTFPRRAAGRPRAACHGLPPRRTRMPAGVDDADALAALDELGQLLRAPADSVELAAMCMTVHSPGARDLAIEAIRREVDAGLRGRRWVAARRDFAALRTDAPFAELLARIPD